MRDARRIGWVPVIMTAFVGLWLLMIPFYGPPGTNESNLTLDSMRTGDRGKCTGPLFARAGASLSDGDALRQIRCQSIGIERAHNGWMLLWTAAAGALAMGVIGVMSKEHISSER